MDHIEFRLIDVPIPSLEPETTTAVAVTVDGRALEDLWAAAGGTEWFPIWVGDLFDSAAWTDGAYVGGRLLWRGDVDLDRAPWFAAVQDGRVGVLTCGCGGFGCGGGTAHIDIDTDTVTWSEFHDVLGRGRVSLGPFTFPRREYEDELDALEHAVRAIRDA